MIFSYPTSNLVEKYLQTFYNNPSISLSSCINQMGYTVGGCSAMSLINAMPLLPGANIPNTRITGIDIPIFFDVSNVANIPKDVPIIIKEPNATKVHKGTIMILEQDPLRNYNQFQQLGASVLQSNAIVGTPNAFHYTPVSFYLILVANLIAKGWSVYLTDTYKIWAQDMNGNIVRWNINQIAQFNNLLCQEIATIKPTKFLLLGKKAQNAYNKLQCPLQFNIPTVAVPHPSGLANRAWKKIPNLNSLKDEEKIKYILSKI